MNLKGSINVLLGLTLLISIISCTKDKKIPPSACAWHPLLKGNKCDLRIFEENLPLGKFEGSDYFSIEAREPGISLSNVNELTRFINHQETYFEPGTVLTRALAFYRQGEQKFMSFIYTALLKEGTTPRVKRENFNIAHPQMLTQTGSFSIYWDTEAIKGVIPEKGNCRLYNVEGEIKLDGASSIMGASMGSHSYAVMAGYKKNLYFEIAIYGSVEEKPAVEDNDDEEDGMKIFIPKLGKKDPVLKKLKQTYDASKLQICDFQ